MTKSVFISWRDVTYEKVDNAGQGGIGMVSKVLAASSASKGVLFAVKVFSPDSPKKEEWKQAFMREVHVLRDCDHPAIVRVFDEGVLEDGRPFFVMEYLSMTLSQAMEDRKLDETERLSIVMQLLSALAGTTLILLDLVAGRTSIYPFLQDLYHDTYELQFDEYRLPHCGRT